MRQDRKRRDKRLGEFPLLMGLYVEKKALVTVPRFHVQGGVTNFFEVLNPSLGNLVQYFEIGGDVDGSQTRILPARLIKDSAAFDRALATGAYDVVHVNPSLGYRAVLRDAVLVLIAYRHDIPVLVFFHGWDKNFASILKGPLRWAFNAVFGRAHTIVVLASAFKDILTDFGVDASIAVLRTAVADDVFESELPRRKYERVRCLFLSRLVKGKGADVAIRAFARLKASLCDITLTIAGDGPERPALERLVKELDVGDVTFTGHISGATKERLMQESNLFLFPSTYGEGLPTALVEAMAYGLPVVTTSVGGIKDFFEDGIMGVVSPAEPAEFAERIHGLMVAPGLLSRIGSYNREYAQKWFSASSVSRDLVSIYKDIRSSMCFPPRGPP